MGSIDSLQEQSITWMDFFEPSADFHWILRLVISGNGDARFVGVNGFRRPAQHAHLKTFQIRFEIRKRNAVFGTIMINEKLKQTFTIHY